MTLPKELKEAISRLPSTEKDKLIFRLLKKDLTLANRLLFELTSEDSVEDKREQVKQRLTLRINSATNHYYSPGYLLMAVRDMSGFINEHVSLTKDKFGEAQLNLWMINKVLEENGAKILSTTRGKANTFCVATIARAFKIMLLIKKMHEDYRIEFEDDLKKLGKLIGNNPYLMQSAIYNGLDVNWMIGAKIPENLEQIHKDLRARGYLK
ncbi:MAG: hypothetical protein H6Q17_1730 [Bacteroidetes bacterium]|nr:hypothetical protein [Bacteroidota bacterium]